MKMLRTEELEKLKKELFNLRLKQAQNKNNSERVIELSKQIQKIQKSLDKLEIDVKEDKDQLAFSFDEEGEK
jgi:hypothetical protein